MRLHRDAVDFVEQDDLCRRERPELGDQRSRGGIDHLKTDDFGRLQVGSTLQTREPGVADGSQDHSEKRLADAGHAS